MKNLLICGASKNLGKFFYSNFKEDYNVFVTARSKINSKNYFKTDFSKKSQLNICFKKIKNKINKIDVIIFCIGNSKKNYKFTANSKNFHDSFIQNFYPFVNLVNIYKKYFKNNTVRIIAISSIAALKNIDAPITYSVAKNALNFYCSIMARDLIKKKIILNLISPGNILLKNNNWYIKKKNSYIKTMKYIKNNVPSGKFCNPVDLLNTCKLLMNGENFVGSNIVVDGGQIL